jgi:hypothetical protein
MRRPLFLLPLLLVFFLTGCAATYGQGTHYPDTRYPDDRRYPDTRTDRYHQRVDRDVHDYVHRLDRDLRLTRRQQQRIGRLLGEHTYRLLDRSRGNDRAVYPFPRQYDRRQHRGMAIWWNEVDRDIERYLDRRQRRVYRQLTDRYDDRDRWDDDRYGKNHGSHQGNGKKRGHHDE